MKRNIFNPLTCGSVDHRVHRRMFLQGLAAGATSLMSLGGLFSMPAFAQQIKREQKHCILLWLCGLKDVVPGFSAASAPNPHPADVVCCAHVSHAARSEAFSATMRRIVTEGRVVDDQPKGAVVVYAAGNDFSDVKVENGFADDPNTIAVANCRINDDETFSRVSSSNFGKAIDLCALGHQLLGH